MAHRHPVPGVNLVNQGSVLAGNQILGLLNTFSGGTMENFSVVMLGVGPYIFASIIFQLFLTMIKAEAGRNEQRRGIRPTAH